jgi:hypothetical protein
MCAITLTFHYQSTQLTIVNNGIYKCSVKRTKQIQHLKFVTFNLSNGQKSNLVRSIVVALIKNRSKCQLNPIKNKSLKG